MDRHCLTLDTGITGHDEVGMLASAFERTLDTARELCETNIRFERERFLTELQTLQERVNPHFLYNTLSSINTMALEIEAVHINSALVSLAEFYRMSLSKKATSYPSARNVI